MSDDFTPLASMASDAREDDTREMAAQLARDGRDVNTINAELQRRGHAPINANSSDLAELSRDRLMRDPEFQKRLAAGDPTATDQAYAAADRIARANGKLMDRPVKAGEYNLGFIPSSEMPYGNAAKFNEEFSSLVASLRLPEASARQMVQDHLHAVNQTKDYDEERREGYEREQSSMLNAALGENAEARLKDASAILSRVSGRTLDLAKIVKTNGADVAVRLLLHAEDLKANGQA
jgi:hypothetical protein